MSFTNRWATPADADRIIELLPRLSDYDLPPNRTSEVFWQGDADLVRTWANGDTPQTIIRVAVGGDDMAMGVAIVTFNKDHFSGEPNAHLETIVVHPDADGTGTGRALIAEMEAEAATRGAHTMSLHVVSNNDRARHVYKGLGYNEEMIRAIKFLPSSPA